MFRWKESFMNFLFGKFFDIIQVHIFLLNLYSAKQKGALSAVARTTVISSLSPLYFTLIFMQQKSVVINFATSAQA